MTISNQASGIRPGVCTSTTRPATPYTGQVILETDTGRMLYWTGSIWQAPWNLQWGRVTYQSNNGTDINFSSETTTLTTNSFTAVANRIYRITYCEPSITYVSGTVNGVAQGIRLTNISGTVLAFQDFTAANISSTGISALTVCETTLSAGSTIINASCATAGGGTARVDRGATRIAFLSVEDIGPA